MVKVVSGIAAFVLTFGFSLSLVGLLFGFTSLVSPFVEPESARGISSFLSQDVRNGQMRDLKIRKELWEHRAAAENSHEAVLPAYSESVSEYVAASTAMEDSALPADLRYAWRDHMEAWKKHDDLLRFAARKGLDEPTFAATYKRTSNDIRETWEQVLRIAERYEVNTSGMR